MTWPQPIPESQNSLDATWACASYATTHSIESQIQKLTGKTVNLSARFLAKMSGTIPTVGNYITKVFDTIYKYGLVEDKDWPQPPVFTNAEYYAEIPQAIIDKGQEFLKEWNLDYLTNIYGVDVPKALITAPLIAWVPQSSPNHFVEVLDEKTAFDSFSPYVKTLPILQKYYQFIIKRKDTMKLVKNGQTFYLEGNKGYFGINKPEFLNLLIKITDQVEERSPVGQQLGIVETVADTFRIKDN